MLKAETLGEAIRLLSYRAGLKQEALAAELGVSSATVSAYLNDASVPSAVVLRRLSNLLAKYLNLASEVLWNELGGLVENTATVIQLDAETRNIARQSEE